MATRVNQGLEFTKKRLNVIENAEDYLRELGFEGCRVKVKRDAALVELYRKDFASFIKDDVRSTVIQKFCNLRLHKILLNLTSR